MAEAGQYPLILDRIQDLIEPVVGGATVHLYQRHVGDWKQMIETFKVGTAPNVTIHGWMISRSDVEEEWLTNMETISDHTIVIRGVMGVKDSAVTEDTFNDYIEAIRTSFRSNLDLGGACEYHKPLKFKISYRNFSGILCHYAEGTLIVRERLLGGY